MKNYFLALVPFLIVLFLGNSNLCSQTPNIGFGNVNSNGTTWVQHLDCSMSSGSGSFQISIENPPAGQTSFHWNVCVRQDETLCTGPQTEIVAEAIPTPMLGLSFNLSAIGTEGILTISTDGTDNTDRVYDVRINIRPDDPARLPEIRDYKIYVRRPIDMVFVLDRSGSMECGEAFTAWPGCIALTGGITNARWGKLENSLQRFANNALPPELNNVSSKTLDNDKYQLQYFSGTAVTSGIGVVPLANLRTGIANDMATFPRLNPSGSANRLAIDGTSLGLGLKNALNYFGTPTQNRRRILLFFTDGEQNSSAGYWVNNRMIQNPSGTDDTPLPSHANIEIYTVGVGLYASGSGLNVLQNILEGGAGTGRFFTNPLGDELINTMPLVLNKIFDRYSPQLVRFEDQKLTNLNKATFPLDGGLSDAFFEVGFEKPISTGRDSFPNFRYKVFRNGQDMTSYAVRKQGNFYATLHINFQKADTALYSRGNWELQVLPESSNASTYFGSKIRLSATADDHAVHFSVNAGGSYFRVCDVIKPSVKLRIGNLGITNATVTATIVEPGADIGDLLATVNVSDIPDENKNSGSCALRKFAVLQQTNPAALIPFLNTKSKVITLQHRGNGLYEGEGYATNPTGIYKIIYHAIAKETNLGIVERTEEQTINVRFPQLTYKIENRKVNKPRSSDGSYFYTLSVKPSFKDCAGKDRFVGPGWEKDLKISGRQISNVTVADQCDSGEYIISVTSRNKIPYIKVDLLDEPIYSGFINDFNKPFNPHKWHVGLGIGATIPKNRLDTLYNSSWFVKLSVDRRISHSFSVGAAAGHWRFDKNFYINGATIGASGYGYIPNWIDNGLPIDISVGVGVGAFKPKNQDLEGGGTAHASIAYDLTPRISLFIEGSYYKLLTSKYDFGTLGGGIRVKF